MEAFGYLPKIPDISSITTKHILVDNDIMLVFHRLSKGKEIKAKAELVIAIMYAERLSKFPDPSSSDCRSRNPIWLIVYSAASVKLVC